MNLNFITKIHKIYKLNDNLYLNMPFNLYLGNFYGIDSFVEFLIIIVSFILSYYSNKIYRLIKNKNYKFFSWAFLLIGISFIFKILSNLTIVHKVTIKKANFIFVLVSELENMQLINFISFIFYKIFYMVGFLILFFILTKDHKKERILFFTYLSFIVVLFSIYFNCIFHITLVLIMIFLVNHFYKNYKKVRTINTFLVLISFIIILVSHVFFIFSEVYSLFYFLGEVFLLIGFLGLLLNQINIKIKQKNVLRTNKK